MDYTPWDDGAATAVTVAVLAVGQPTLCNGPGVFLGYSLKNSAGGTAQIEFLDGGAQELWQTSIAAGGNQQGDLPDRGVKFMTDLEISVAGNTPVNGVVWVRLKEEYERREEEWHKKSGHSKSQSHQAPLHQHHSQEIAHSHHG